MKMNPLLTLSLSGALLALTAQAQQAPPPIRILPAPAPPAPDFAPDFDGPDMPEEGWIEPGFPGEMMMPPMPGRYTLLSANIQKDGKLTPIVLRIDTQTGQVWQLKTTARMIRRNGKLQPETQLSFVMVAEPAGGLGGGVLPGLPAPGAPTNPGGIGRGFVPPATGIVEPQPAPAPVPLPAPRPFPNPKPREKR